MTLSSRIAAAATFVFLLGAALPASAVDRVIYDCRVQNPAQADGFSNFKLALRADGKVDQVINEKDYVRVLVFRSAGIQYIARGHAESPYPFPIWSELWSSTTDKVPTHWLGFRRTQSDLIAAGDADQLGEAFVVEDAEPGQPGQSVKIRAVYSCRLP